MLKKKHYLINWLIVAIVCVVYITFIPKTDTLKELAGAILIGLTTAGLGFYIENIITKSKNNHRDYEDKQSL